MPLERLHSIPKFSHNIDEYELNRMEPVDAYMARRYSQLHQSQDWNNNQTLLLTNAVVDVQEQFQKWKEEQEIKDQLWEERDRAREELYEKIDLRMKKWESIITGWKARVGVVVVLVVPKLLDILWDALKK